MEYPKDEIFQGLRVCMRMILKTVNRSRGNDEFELRKKRLRTHNIIFFFLFQRYFYFIAPLLREDVLSSLTSSGLL